MANKWHKRQKAQPPLAKREAAAPKPTGEGGLVSASYGLASHAKTVRSKRVRHSLREA